MVWTQVCNGTVHKLDGKRMLRTLDAIFMELDMTGVPTHAVVSCPHTDIERGDSRPVVYRGRRLDFCFYCHGEVVREMQASIKRHTHTPAEHRTRARLVAN